MPIIVPQTPMAGKNSSRRVSMLIYLLSAALTVVSNDHRHARQLFLIEIGGTAV